MNYTAIIKRPVITEKSTIATSQHRFTFEVAKIATKPQIKTAIENIFNVSVKNIRTTIVTNKSKRGRQNRQINVAPAWKKAIVELKPGEKIDLFDTKTS